MKKFEEKKIEHFKHKNPDELENYFFRPNRRTITPFTT